MSFKLIGLLSKLLSTSARRILKSNFHETETVVDFMNIVVCYEKNVLLLYSFASRDTSDFIFRSHDALVYMSGSSRKALASTSMKLQSRFGFVSRNVW